MDSIDFVYDRVGRYINPGENKMDWLSSSGSNVVNPDKAKSRLGMAGCVIHVTEQDCIFTGNFRPDFVGDAGHIEFVPISEMGNRYGVKAGIRPFLLDCIFNTPRGYSAILDLGGKRLIQPGCIALNSDSNYVRVSTLDGQQAWDKKAILGAFDKMQLKEEEINRKTISKLRAAASLIDGFRSNQLSDREQALFNAEVRGSAFASVYDKLQASGSTGNFFSYITYLSEVVPCKK